MKNLKTPDEYEAEIRALACGDNSCRVIKPRGMATNGGCRCVSSGRQMMSPLDADDAMKLWKVIQLRREQVKALCVDAEQFKSDRDHWHREAVRLAASRNEWKANHKRAVDSWTQDAQDLKVAEERIQKMETLAQKLREVLLDRYRFTREGVEFTLEHHDQMCRLIAEILDPKLPE